MFAFRTNIFLKSLAFPDARQVVSPLSLGSWDAPPTSPFRFCAGSRFNPYVPAGSSAPIEFHETFTLSVV